MPTPLPSIVAANVVKLLRHRHPDMRPHEVGVTRLVEEGVSQGTAARVLKGDTQIGLARLEEVAKALRVQAWQLMVPDLDPSSLPGLTAAPSWPFEMVDSAAYWALSVEDRVFLQGRLQQWLETAGAKLAAASALRLGNGR